MEDGTDGWQKGLTLEGEESDQSLGLPKYKGCEKSKGEGKKKREHRNGGRSSKGGRATIVGGREGHCRDTPRKNSKTTMEKKSANPCWGGGGGGENY